MLLMLIISVKGNPRLFELQYSYSAIHLKYIKYNHLNCITIIILYQI